MFKKILIANRGEIALRVICACKELGIKAVAIYSEADRNSLHVRFADEAICIGPPRLHESYLNIPAVISAAEIANVDAIHPGYGLLSENANFAEVCQACGIKFIGPPPEVTRLMGEKEKARATMKKQGVPILPGSDGIIASADEALEWARSVGFPVIVKASAGGGGRGMRVIRDEKELPNLFHSAQSEAAAAFGNGDLYMEKFIERPRHIEFQVLADEHGNVMSLGERECSIQRRHQKLVEEAPSVKVTPGAARPHRRHPGEDAQQHRLHERRHRRVPDGRRWQPALHRDEHAHPGGASGHGDDHRRRPGEVADHDCGRREAERASSRSRWSSADTPSSAASMPSIRRRFTPSAGKITVFNMPGGTGIRVDTAAYAEGVIPPYYDSLIAKLVCARPRSRRSHLAHVARAGDVRGRGNLHHASRCTSGSCAILTSAPATSIRSSWNASWRRQRREMIPEQYLHHRHGHGEHLKSLCLKVRYVITVCVSVSLW